MQQPVGILPRFLASVSMIIFEAWHSPLRVFFCSVQQKLIVPWMYHVPLYHEGCALRDNLCWARTSRIHPAQIRQFLCCLLSRTVVPDVVAWCLASRRPPQISRKKRVAEALGAAGPAGRHVAQSLQYRWSKSKRVAVAKSSWSAFRVPCSVQEPTEEKNSHETQTYTFAFVLRSIRAVVMCKMPDKIGFSFSPVSDHWSMILCHLWKLSDLQTMTQPNGFKKMKKKTFPNIAVRWLRFPQCVGGNYSWRCIEEWKT